MFVREHFYSRLRRHSIEKARAHIQLNAQRHWRTNEPSDAEGIGLPMRGMYAQNDCYLELCNPGWDFQWRAGILFFFSALPALFIIWAWYGFAVHPLIFEKIIFFFPPKIIYQPDDWPYLVFGWFFAFPMALGAIFLLYIWLWRNGGITAWFTLTRGRIRFNRQTRKVYVLRPSFCGGNAVFEWDRLVALLNPEAPDPWGEQKIKAIALYHPPFDPNDPEAKGEDCIFVGPSLHFSGTDLPKAAVAFWEYIRLYMQDGPSIDYVPAESLHLKQVPRYLAPVYSTYCGLPDKDQYQLEHQSGFVETICHMLSQMTCTWPSFPKEWNSDSGLGEPENRPVQTGAVMTALVYRAKGKLSKDDEVEFIRHWGTPEGLAEAMEP